MRWLLDLAPLLGCGLMCFGGVILAVIGIGRASGADRFGTTATDAVE